MTFIDLFDTYIDMSLNSEASEKIVERLAWHTANRDQAGIAQDLADGNDIPEVYGLGEASLFDEFFYFLDHFGIMDLFVGIDPNSKKRKSKVPFAPIVLIYMMRIVAGLKFFCHIGPVILRSQSLMRLVGFNGRQVRDGTSKRGTKKSTPDDNGLKEQQPTKIRGPVCTNFIAATITAVLASALENIFNKVVTILAANSFFPKNIEALLDASQIESTEQCDGCGKVTKEKPPELRRRKKRIRKVVETVFGFKLWAIWDPNSCIPLAIRFDTIEVHDINLAKELVQQAIVNLGDHARIKTLAIDRGFMDGTLLYWLDSIGITFYIPAKTNMTVYEDALSLIGTGYCETRTKDRSTGYGNNKTITTDYYKVEGLDALTSAGFYGPMGSGSHENKKDFVPNPINAVVVLDDPFKKNNPNSDTMVILTNAPVAKPMKIYDGYDARSEIENTLFREAKQAWFIERPAQNTRAGFQVHVYLTILLMGLTSAYQDWMDQQDKMENDGKNTGIRKFREKIKEENGNKLIIFDQDRYAIFDAYEVFILCGRNVLRPTGVPEKITKENILRKYGVQLE
ncbi:MAG: transposase [Desulfobacteraceae bacterium]|nr:transposase [Desulfobacteraceae bacterium]